VLRTRDPAFSARHPGTAGGTPRNLVCHGPWIFGSFHLTARIFRRGHLGFVQSTFRDLARAFGRGTLGRGRWRTRGGLDRAGAHRLSLLGGPTARLHALHGRGRDWAGGLVYRRSGRSAADDPGKPRGPGLWPIEAFPHAGRGAARQFRSRTALVIVKSAAVPMLSGPMPLGMGVFVFIVRKTSWRNVGPGRGQGPAIEGGAAGGPGHPDGPSCPPDVYRPFRPGRSRCLRPCSIRPREVGAGISTIITPLDGHRDFSRHRPMWAGKGSGFAFHGRDHDLVQSLSID